MGLSTLISAIEYLEYMEGIHQQMGSVGGRQLIENQEERGTPSTNSLHFRRLDSTASGSVVINQEEQLQHRHQIQQEVPPVAKEVKGEEETTTFKSLRNNGLPPGMLAKRRKMHNILEKSRRAQMRGCLNILKGILPAPTSHPGTPYGRILTTSITLVNSVKYIKQLEVEGGELEGEKKRLEEIRREMEGKLEELMEEVGGDLKVEVQMEKEITKVPWSTSTVEEAATPIQEEPPSRPSLDISPVPGVTVEEAVTITPEIPSMKFNDCTTVQASVSINPAPDAMSSTQMSPFGLSTTTPVLCDLLRHGLPPPVVPPSCRHLFPGGSLHGYNFERSYSNANPNPPSEFPPPPIVQFLFANRFFNMLPFCSLPGGGGGGGGSGGRRCGDDANSRSTTSSPPPLDYFTQSLSGGGSGGGCYGGGGVGGGQANSRFFK